MRDGFSILIPAEDSVGVFWENINLSYIAAPPQKNLWTRLILNLLVKPNEGTTSVNYTTGREFVLESIHFRRTFPRIFQAICELDP